jgi:Zn finger protein HypA/HybF involved in hydrogenase expression
MAEHFTKSTVEAKFWCAKCGGPTMHYVHDGRRGGCQACIQRLAQLGRDRKSEPAKPKQGELF